MVRCLVRARKKAAGDAVDVLAYLSLRNKLARIEKRRRLEVADLEKARGLV